MDPSPSTFEVGCKSEVRTPVTPKTSECLQKLSGLGCVVRVSWESWKHVGTGFLHIKIPRLSEPRGRRRRRGLSLFAEFRGLQTRVYPEATRVARTRKVHSVRSFQCTKGLGMYRIENEESATKFVPIHTSSKGNYIAAGSYSPRITRGHVPKTERHGPTFERCEPI